MPEPILGWRLWDYDPFSKGLIGFYGKLWKERELTASCSAQHLAPQEECTCGIYSLRVFSDAIGLSKVAQGFFHARIKQSLIIFSFAFTVGISLLPVLTAVIYSASFHIRSVFSLWTCLAISFLIVSLICSLLLFKPLFRLWHTRQVLGIVASKGKVYMYEEGMRAQKSQIIGLYALEPLSDKAVLKLKRIYGVNVFKSAIELQNFAAEHGTFVPHV